MEKIIQSNSPTLALLNKMQPQKAIAGVELLIDDLVNFFNVGKTMGADQIGETRKLIIKHYYFLKPDDLRACFEEVKLGRHGQAFDRIDGNTILIALKDYTERRMNIAESLVVEKHRELKELDNGNDKLFVKVGDEFIRDTGDGFSLVLQKELATRFDFITASNIKTWLIKHHYPNEAETVKIHYADKPEIGLIEHLMKEKPELVSDKDKYLMQTKDYFEKRAAIEKDESLDELERFNKLRQLAGLEPFDNGEYWNYVKSLQRAPQ
jgi:hypothetical protein